MASVLMLNLPPEKRNLLQVLSIRMDYVCRDISPQEQLSRISDLLSGTPKAMGSGKPFRDEMLIMDGFSHQDLNFLLNEMIRTGHTVSLKAVTTPTNLAWTVIQLHAQLLAESNRLGRRSPEVPV